MNQKVACSELAIKNAVRTLLDGDLVAFPTETVYGLGADSQNENAISKVYKVKGRPKDHPIIVHISSADKIGLWASEIPDYAAKLARFFWPGPLTLILPRTELAKDFITGGQNYVGLRVPSQHCALSLLVEFELNGGTGIAAPSANRFGKISPTSAQDVEFELLEYLDDKDIILDGGSSSIGIESTIIDCTTKFPRILRPGAVTTSMIHEVIGFEIADSRLDNKVRASGLLNSHYSPQAQVYLDGVPSKGDGFLALSKIETPYGVVRLASPRDVSEYARVLYGALRLADQKNLKKVFAVLPEGDGLVVAIRDRLLKAASK
jgi:L-threonylcarbamoyladenylate synthase